MSSLPSELLVLLQDTKDVVNCTRATDCLVLSGASRSLAKLFTHNTATSHKFAYQDIINARYDPATMSLEITFLINASSHKRTLVPRLRAVLLDPEHSQAAQAWTDALMQSAYFNVKAHRRFKVLLNPKSGQGKALSLWKKRLAPIFSSAEATIDYQETTHRNHAAEIAASLEVTQYDALILISGDGPVHEVLNGLAQRKDALQALKLPIGIIPAGTSNGLWVSIAGPKLSKNLAYAILNILKGRPLSMDLCLVSQPNCPLLYSFLTQAYGLLADCDLGTEHLRWMGGNRVFIGYLQGVLAGRSYPCDIYLKIEERDMKVMENRTRREGSHQSPKQEPHEASLLPEEPPLEVDLSAEEGWTKIDLKSVATLYAGKVPWVDPSVMAFPLVSNDGLIDVAILKGGSRMAMIQGMEGAEKGIHIFHKAFQYYKVKAYRVVPKSSKTYMAVDGEAVPCNAMQVECRQNIACCLSLNQGWSLGESWSCVR